MKLRSTRDVIAALGGIRAVATLTKRRYGAAANWNQFTRFPANTYRVMQLALQERGLNAPAHLWGMTEPSSTERYTNGGVQNVAKDVQR